ncbi:hypothetical protein CANARDRAFT_177942 [[Candida] arabinofermentans NRRL YB-2248]|uniref:Thioesterase domain-containing protein n=1 Tax=[Candida] arabinofermentans NRRL YB-2248 TaxID=983967 RepID=A0A1E4SUG9_9ASCO|nr:hypothetical protein CANARDRAFT_177942 [[Candida] arabinofermentans NRRL YB-2248]
MNAIARATKFTALSTISFGVGLSLFGRPWPETTPSQISTTTKQSLSILKSIQSNELYQKLSQPDSKYKMLLGSQLIPEAHRINHVGQGILNSPKHIAIDPIIFMNNEEGKFYFFSHLGPQLVGNDDKVHNGVIATLLDESLCFCGFSKLPSKRGVTAKLNIEFKEKSPPNSNLMLFAEVVQNKGRKCVIKGYVETIPVDKSDRAIRVADATCILVEPKWFKYLNWVPLF